MPAWQLSVPSVVTTSAPCGCGTAALPEPQGVNTEVHVVIYNRHWAGSIPIRRADARTAVSTPFMNVCGLPSTLSSRRRPVILATLPPRGSLADRAREPHTATPPVEQRKPSCAECQRILGQGCQAPRSDACAPQRAQIGSSHVHRQPPAVTRTRPPHTQTGQEQAQTASQPSAGASRRCDPDDAARF